MSWEYPGKEWGDLGKWRSFIIGKGVSPLLAKILLDDLDKELERKLN